MRLLISVSVIMMSLMVEAQVNFTGIYTGKLNGDFTQIEIQQTGNKAIGKYKETGNTYELKGEVKSGQLIGELLVAGTSTQLATFVADKNTAGIHMELMLLGVTKVGADFTKSNSSLDVSSVATNASSSGKAPAPPKDQFSRDPAVVGNWIKEEVLNSGVGDLAASLVTVYFLQFRGDGTFIQEKSSGAGGSNWSAVDQRTPDVSGHWHTKDQIMYVRPLGQNDYVRLNRYLFHNGALVFKTEAGKYLIWNRN